MMDKVCVFPGTFDPFTIGHFDVTERASRIFKKVIVAINETSLKNGMFTASEREQIAKKSLKSLRNVEVVLFNELLTDFCRKVNANIVIRGLRTASDLEYENALSEAYKTQDNGIELVYFLNSQKYSHIRGTIVRDLIRYKANLAGFVHADALSLIQRTI